MVSVLFVDNCQQKELFESKFVLTIRAIPHKAGTKSEIQMRVH